MKRIDMHRLAMVVAISGGIAALASSPAEAATLCVGDRSGCYPTIGAAVHDADPGDTIEVAHGVYHEDVVIGKPLSLVGKNAANTIIDASGLANGVYVDGLDNPGLSHVTISGFTIRNANFEGVLVTNTSDLTLEDNRISGNDRGLVLGTAPTCPGLPDFETSEDVDCGEAVHVIGIDHSKLSNNLVEDNAGGFLVTDETGPTHDNVITRNIVRNNVFDCGITIPTHPRAPQFGSALPPFGIYGITVSNNIVSGNGVKGAGAGVGLFGFLPGGRVSDNVVVGNIIIGNGLPGIAVHAHSPGLNINNNQFVDNYIARNGQDTDDAATPGPTGINIYSLFPIYGNVVERNVIKREAVDLVFHINVPAGATPVLTAHENDLNGPAIGVDNIGVGAVDATRNWWGCAQGPGAHGCSSVEGPNVTDKPFLRRPAVPNGSPKPQD